MKTLQQLHDEYMRSRDTFDNYNVDDDYEAQQINEYYNTGDEVFEPHWEPVSNLPDPAKLNILRKHNEGR